MKSTLKMGLNSTWNC